MPGHFFYGVLGLDKYNIETFFMENSFLGNRIWISIKVALQIIFNNKKYDLIYAATPYGLELLVLLRSLGIFNKPIIVWQHRALKASPNPWVNKMLKFYYSGFSKMIMFTDMHIKETLSNGATTREKLMQMNWGPDTNYFDGIIADNPDRAPINYFCSTGRENRDFPTLIKAFSVLPDSILKIYTTRLHGAMNNEKLLSDYTHSYSNVQVSIVESKNINKFLSKEVSKSICAVVSCHEHNYTVGLTSLLEAMALKTAIITSDNPYFPFDVEQEGFGLKVPYGDVDAWTKAAKYLSDHPEIAIKMGEKGREYVDKYFNLDLLTQDVAKCLYQVAGKNFSMQS